MIRFLFNFVLFGLIFFAIHKFAPDGFQTLVSAVSAIYDFLADIVMWAVESVKNLRAGAGG